MRYELFIASRYIFSKRQEKFISVITLFSILGVAVGVATLIATLAVMSGFDNELKVRIIGSNPHIFVERESGISDIDKIARDINAIKGVKGSFPYIWSQGIIQFRGRAKGIVLRSVDAKNELDASKIFPYIISISAKAGAADGLIIGNELASALGVYINDEIMLITPASKRPHKIMITAVFKSGMYDYDANVVYAGFENLASIFDNKPIASGIGVDCISLAGCAKVKQEILERLGHDFIVSTWSERNRNLFSAIKLEKLTMFVILTLIVLVACFSIIGVLVITVMKKAKDIGILKTIGVSRKGILAIFSIQGFIIGATGVVFGLLGGLGASFLLEKFVRLPQEVYYIDRIPVRFNISDAVIIIIAALCISLLATIYPAYQASRLEPIQALRYE